MKKKKISELPKGAKFKIGLGSADMIVFDHKDGKVRYRYSITDFPNKAHFSADPSMMVWPQ